MRLTVYLKEGQPIVNLVSLIFSTDSFPLKGHFPSIHFYVAFTPLVPSHGRVRSSKGYFAIITDFPLCVLGTCPLLRDSGSPRITQQKNEVKQGQLLIGIWGWEEAVFIEWIKKRDS